MKIVIKHIDNLKSSLVGNKIDVPQYLVYLMTEDNVSITCEIVNGNDRKVNLVNKINEKYDYKLNIFEISHREFKDKMRKNLPTYGEY